MPEVPLRMILRKAGLKDAPARHRCAPIRMRRDDVSVTGISVEFVLGVGDRQLVDNLGVAHLVAHARRQRLRNDALENGA